MTYPIVLMTCSIQTANRAHDVLSGGGMQGPQNGNKAHRRGRKPMTSPIVLMTCLTWTANGHDVRNGGGIEESQGSRGHRGARTPMTSPIVLIHA